MKRSYLKRSFNWRKKATPLRKSGFHFRLTTSDHSAVREGPKRANTLKACGKKAKLREVINQRLRRRFRAMGLYDVCEARLAGCWNTDLTWAHGKKDDQLTMAEREFLVIRACTPCHRLLDEEMGHQGMLEFVESVIAQRREAA